MNRQYLRALSSLLRQAASAAEATALPSSCRFSLPANAPFLQPLIALQTVSFVHPSDNNWNSTQATSPPINFTRNFSTDNTTALPLDSSTGDHLESIGVSNEDADALRADPLFIEIAHYLGTKLSMVKVDVERLLLKLSFSGISADGQFFCRSQPIELSLHGSIVPTIQLLEQIPGINIGRAVRNSPFILLQSVQQHPRLLATKKWLEDTLELRGTDLGKIVSSTANVLARELTEVEKSIQFLLNLNFTTAQVRSMVTRSPRILVIKPERMEESVHALRSIGLDEVQIKAVLWKNPGVLMTSSIKIYAIAKWVESRGVSAASLASTLARFPTFFSFSIKSKLDPTFDYLHSDLQLSDKTIGRILTHAPDAFGRSIHRIKNNISAMTAAGLTGSHLSSYLAANPGALRCDFAAHPYSTKLKFLKEELDREIGPTLACNPMFTTYSIQRIASRAAFLKESGRSMEALTSWLSWRDVEFSERLAGKPFEEWSEFKERWTRSAAAQKWLTAN